MKRCIPLFVVLLLTSIGLPAARAQDQPVAMLSVKSPERVLNLLGSVGRWLALNGTAEEQQQGAQMMQSMVEPFLANLDQNKPVGAVVWLSPEGAPDALVFLPLEDPTTLINSIAPLVGQPEQAGNVTTFNVPGMPPILVQAKGDWTFVAMSQQRLDAAPANPAALLGPLPRLYDVALRLKVQAVPAALRDQMLEGASQSLPGLIAPGPGNFDETEGADPLPGGADPFPCDSAAPQDLLDEGNQPPFAQGDPAMQAAMEQQIAMLRKFLNETDQLVLGFAVDDAKQELRVDFIQKAVAGSATAKVFNGWNTKRPTRFAGFYRAAAGIHLHLNMNLAAETVASLTQQLDDATKMLGQPEGGAPPDPAQQQVANTFIGVLKALVGHSDPDVVLSLVTADEPSLLLGGKVADVASVFKAIGLAEVAMADLPGVTMRKETVGGVPLSVWSVPIPDAPDAAPVKAALGPVVEVAAGAAQDNAYVAVGPPGILAKLEAALAQSAAPTVRSPVPAMLLVDLQKLVGNLDLGDIPGVGEWASQMANVKAPMHIRWSTIPSPNAGMYRIQIGGGAVFALAPRADASEGFDADPAFDPDAAFDAEPAFGDDAR